MAEAESRRKRRKALRDPGIWMPGDEVLGEESVSPSAETRFSADSYGGRGSAQVGVRLRRSDFENLQRAAGLYGVRPTSLARMMIIRGVNAILKAELRRSRELLRDD